MKQLCQNKHTIRFRYWSRKKYAMFYSLGKYVTIGNLKKEKKKLCDSFDHSLIYEVGSLKAETVAALQNEDFHLEKVSFRPTAENFAYYFYKELTELGYEVHCVEVYETPNNCAVYEEE